MRARCSPVAMRRSRPAELQELVAIATDLQNQLRRVDAELPAPRKARTVELRSNLQRLERIARNGLYGR